MVTRGYMLDGKPIVLPMALVLLGTADLTESVETSQDKARRSKFQPCPE
jgi:hypothetical protein